VATSNRQGEAYLGVLRQSISSLSLPGEGWDTFRFWEIMSCGACLISPRIAVDALRFINPPRDRHEYIGFDTDLELIDIVRYYDGRRDLLHEVSFAGQQWAMAHQTGVNRARSVLDYVDSVLKNDWDIAQAGEYGG